MMSPMKQYLLMMVAFALAWLILDKAGRVFIWSLILLSK